MKKYLVLYAVAVTALFVCSHRRYRAENRRLVQNQTALAAEVAHYRTQAGQEAASAQVLRLRCGEFEALRAADAEEIRRLGLKIRRLEAAAKTVTATEAAIRAPLRDTVVVRIHDTLPVRDTVRMFRWRDPWISVEGRIGRDSAACRIRSVDTLRQAGIRTQLYTEQKKFKQKMSYADKLGVPYVVFLGEDEVRLGAVSVKDMISGEQNTLPLDQAVVHMKNDLAVRAALLPIREPDRD